MALAHRIREACENLSSWEDAWVWSCSVRLGAVAAVHSAHPSCDLPTIAASADLAPSIWLSLIASEEPVKISAHGKMPGCGLGAVTAVQGAHASCDLPTIAASADLEPSIRPLHISSEGPVIISAHGKMPGCGLAACVLAPSPPFKVHTRHAICPTLRHLLTLQLRYDL